MTSKKKILEEVLPLKLIRAVERWPVLYMKDCPERNNLHFKNKVWQEVAKGLIDNWDSLSRAEKEDKATDLCKKWRNLRDTFKRQLAVDKKVREGQKIKKKEYVYFRHMTFLLPHVTTDEELSDSKQPSRAAAGDHDRRKRPSTSGTVNTIKKVHLSHDELDEDEHFLMSLLPSFKRMNDDEKLTAKVEVLKVIREVRKNSLRRQSPARPEGLLPVLEVNALNEERGDTLNFHEEDEVIVKEEPFADYSIEINEDNSLSGHSGADDDSD